MQEIRISVPEERVPDFYRWFGAWLAGEQSASGESNHDPRSYWTNPDDIELARMYWGKLSSEAQSLHSYLIDRPGEKIRGDQLAAELEVKNGDRGVAGLLAWPGRRVWKLQRHLPIRHDDGYWMEPEIAAMFAAVRDEFGDV